MMIKSFKFMFIIANLCIYCGFSTCQSTDHKIWQSSNFSYDFQNPNKVLSLSDTLREISGIVNDGAYFWAINDEQGMIYKLDAKNGFIQHQYTFLQTGDFEDLVKLSDDRFIVLKSQGSIFDVKIVGDSVTSQKIPVKFLNKSFDLEGLCLNEDKSKLLMACKGPGADTETWVRNVYLYDLKNMALEEKPYLSITHDQLKEFIKANVPPENQEIFKDIFNEEMKELKFGPSAIAIHPTTNDIYVLSSVGKMLVVLDRETKSIKSLAKLDKKLLVQPEGLSFAPDGTLFISSEGKANSSQGKILTFNYNENKK